MAPEGHSVNRNGLFRAEATNAQDTAPRLARRTARVVAGMHHSTSNRHIPQATDTFHKHPHTSQASEKQGNKFNPWTHSTGNRHIPQAMDTFHKQRTHSTGLVGPSGVGIMSGVAGGNWSSRGMNATAVHPHPR